jgi:hypothetical protein
VKVTSLGLEAQKRPLGLLKQANDGVYSPFRVDMNGCQNRKPVNLILLAPVPLTRYQMLKNAYLFTRTPERNE